MTAAARRSGPLALLVGLLGAMAGCAPSGPGAAADIAGARAYVSGEAPARTYLEAGRRLLAAGEPELALDAFTASLGTEGMSAEALIGAGVAAQRQGLLTLARRYFGQASEIAPDSVPAYNHLGVVLFLLGDYHGARDAFATAWRLSGERHETVRLNLVQAEEAVARVEAGMAPDPAYSHRVVRLGSDLFRLAEAPASADAEGAGPAGVRHAAPKANAAPAPPEDETEADG